MSEPSEEVEVKGPAGFNFRARGADLISLLGLIAMVAAGVILYAHMVDMKESSVAMAATNRDVAAALQSSNVTFQKSMADIAKRIDYQTCILVTDPAMRENQYLKPNSFCNRVSN